MAGPQKTITPPNPQTPKTPPSKVKISFETLVGCFGILGGVFAVIAVVIALAAPEKVIVAIRDVGNVPEPTAIVIELPTYTPVPTLTPYPTQSPYPTYTPYLTASPYSTYTPYPTASPYPTYTPDPTSTRLPATSIPPTQTPWIIIATETATPTPTESENTPAGTILTLGERWKQNGVVLVLDDLLLDPDRECIGVKLKLYNETDHEIIVSGKEHHFRAVDNLGRSWTLHKLASGYYCRFSETSRYIRPDQMVASIPPGTQLDEVFCVHFVGQLTDKKVNYVDIVVDGLSQITGATWRISVYH